jgi:hypothetical protein
MRHRDAPAIQRNCDSAITAAVENLLHALATGSSRCASAIAPTDRSRRLTRADRRPEPTRRSQRNDSFRAADA